MNPGDTTPGFRFFASCINSMIRQESKAKIKIAPASDAGAKLKLNRAVIERSNHLEDGLV